MELYYYKSRHGNFGDDLNPWLWPQLIPDIRTRNPGTLFVGIGTVLNKSIPSSGPKVVFGSGVGYGELPEIDDTWSILCVRGPLTAEALKLPADVAVTDPAVLLRSLNLPLCQQQLGVSFIPHHVTARRAPWNQICKLAGISYISPMQHPRRVVNAIRSSRLVLAESMHGAIVSDVFGIPWIPVLIHRKILRFKWQDWCSSVNLSYDPITVATEDFRGPIKTHLAAIQALRIVFSLKKIARNVPPTLSNRGILEDRYQRLLQILKRFTS